MSGFPNLSTASRAAPRKRRTEHFVGRRGVTSADWSEAHRPTSAPAPANATARRETEYAGPPYSGLKLVPARNTFIKVGGLRRHVHSRGSGLVSPNGPMPN